VHKQVAVQTPPGMVKTDNSFVDLQPGWTVRVVLPLLKPGASTMALQQGEAAGNTVTLKADNLEGYATVRYSVSGTKIDRVRLQWLSAEESRNGQARSLTQAPPLPFQFPGRAARVRLIYLVRVSEADHNMAIAAAKRLETLNAFTAQLRRDPAVCGTTRDVFCSWVPSGIAVRPENH